MVSLTQTLNVAQMKLLLQQGEELGLIVEIYRAFGIWIRRPWQWVFTSHELLPDQQLCPGGYYTATKLHCLLAVEWLLRPGSQCKHVRITTQWWQVSSQSEVGTLSSGLGGWSWLTPGSTLNHSRHQRAICTHSFCLTLTSALPHTLIVTCTHMHSHARTHTHTHKYTHTHTHTQIHTHTHTHSQSSNNSWPLVIFRTIFIMTNQSHLWLHQTQTSYFEHCTQTHYVTYSYPLFLLASLNCRLYWHL